MQEEEQATDRSHYTHKSDSSYEDEDDKALALEVENAIREVNNTEENKAIPEKPKETVIPDTESPENELLQIAAETLSRIQKTAGNVQNKVPIEFKPLELKFSDEIYLQSLATKPPEKIEQMDPPQQQIQSEFIPVEVAVQPIISPPIPNIDLTQSVDNFPKLIPHEPEIKPPQTAVPRPKQSNIRRDLDKAKKEKENEMKRLMEEMAMMEEDDLSRQIEQAECRKKFGPYALKLKRSELLDFLSSGELAIPVQCKPCQKICISDPDEGFIKYSIQGPAKITPKMLQELFTIKEIEKPKPKEIPKVDPNKEFLDFFAAPLNLKINSLPTCEIPAIPVTSKSIIISETVIFKHDLESKICTCNNDKISEYLPTISKMQSYKIPKFEQFLKETFYRVFASTQKQHSKIQKPQNVIALEQISEEQQMAELNALCDQDELNLLDSLPINSEEIEHKNSPQTDFSKISRFIKAKRILLQMNQLNTTSFIKPLINLRELYLAQNKIARLDPTAFQNLEELRILHADVNLIEKIEGLEKCRKLEVLKLDSNRIKQIEGLSKCTQLKYLNLYRNQITELNGLENLVFLQHLDLGRNKIQNIAYLLDKIPMISELLLYYNEIEQFPAGFSKILLKSLWLNGNKMLNFSIGYCPLLENLVISENALISVSNFAVLPLLESLDISFNNIMNIESLFEPLKGCNSLSKFKFNDNPLMKGRDNALNSYIAKILPNAKEINGETFIPDKNNNSFKTICSCKNSVLANQIKEIGKIELLEQLFFSRIQKSEKFKGRDEKINFLKESPYMDYLFKYSGAFHFNHILNILKYGNLYVMNDIQNIYENALKSSKKERESAHKILSLFIRRKVENRIKLRKYKKSELKIIKIQAFIRGVQTRKIYEQAFGKLRRKNKKQKKTKDYFATKIQAVAKGFLLRKRIKKGLENAKKKKENFDDCPEIDIENFLGKNEPNIDDDLIIVPDQGELKAILEKIKVPRNYKSNSMAEGSILPSITGNNKNPLIMEQTPSKISSKLGNIDHLPELNQKNLNGLSQIKRPPTGSEISEYDLKSESQRNSTNFKQFPNETGSRKAMEEVRQKINQNKEKDGKTAIIEKSKKFAEEWGLKGEDSKKVVEAWMGKKAKRKQKNKVLTAEERYKKFLMNKPPPGNTQTGTGSSWKSKIIQQ